MDEPLSNLDKVVLGVRPEYIAINNSGKLKAKVYTTLPTGMETTVKVSLQDMLLSAVVFGSVDYNVDEDISIDFTKDNIVLFDKESTNRVAVGKLEV